MKPFIKEKRNSNSVFVNKVSLNSGVVKSHNSLNVFMQTLNFEKVCHVRVNSRNFIQILQARNCGGGGGGPSLLFFFFFFLKTEKGVLILEKKAHDFNRNFIRNVVLTVSRRKNSKIIPCLFFCMFLTKCLLNCLVPWNLPSFEKFLIARLHGDITLKSMSQTKEKWDSLVLSRSYLWMVWRCHGRPRVQCYYFCLKPTVRKDIGWERLPSQLQYFFWKVAFWKLLDHRYVQSFFSAITRHIENSILKDTLQLENLRIWINISSLSRHGSSLSSRLR